MPSATAPQFSNVFASFDDFGLTQREYRVWEGAGFAQDDYRIQKSLMLNIGLRYERLGQFGDKLGRNSSFDIGKADANPPPDGSVAGYVVASNFPGVPPAGVSRASNTFGNDGAGQNTIAPRIGFAWQISPQQAVWYSEEGMAVYYSRPTGQAFYQNLLGAPFSVFRLNAGAANAHATFQEPFPQPFPTPESFPLFPAYSPTTATTIYSVAPGFRPAMVQQYSLESSSRIAPGLFVGSWIRGYSRYSPGTPTFTESSAVSVRRSIQSGESTENTLANVSLRVPILGVPPDSLQEMESEGSSWYNGLEMSLTKRLSHGFQFLASYTFSKTLDTDGADINSTSSGNALTLGDQNSPAQRWGRASFDRTHRFVFSTTWNLPGPSHGMPRAVLGDWSLAAIATVQSGSALTIAETNPTNVFGISEDRAQLSGTCSKNQLVKAGPGGVETKRLFQCFLFYESASSRRGWHWNGVWEQRDRDCGWSRTSEPGCRISKSVVLNRPHEKSNLQFRAEFYNALNHPQFANPDNNFTSPTFGVISNTAVNARVAQLALRFTF